MVIVPAEAVKEIFPPCELSLVFKFPRVILAPEILISLPGAVKVADESIINEPLLFLSASALKMIEPVPGKKFKETPLAMVMFLVASKTILPATCSKVVALRVISVPGNWVKSMLGRLFSASGGSKVLAIRIFSGSSKRVPQFPAGVLTLTLPEKVRVSLPETSTNPPFPPVSPPRASTVP